MRKGMRTMIIVLVAALVLAFTAIPVSADTYAGVKNIDITKANVSTKVGKQETLQVAVSYVGTKPNMKNITWTSSNTAVATVKGGVVVAKKTGTAKITAKLNGKADVCTVKVAASPAKWLNTAGAYTELNKYRKSARVKVLKRDANLEKIAKVRAEEMAKYNKFSHTRPNGKSGLTLIKGNVYKGENIAKGQKTCVQVSKAWYASPGHKKNMLRKQFTKVGIAAYEYNGVVYWAQVFSS